MLPRVQAYNVFSKGIAQVVHACISASIVYTRTLVFDAVL
jgi:hypothetical protein